MKKTTGNREEQSRTQTEHYIIHSTRIKSFCKALMEFKACEM